LKMDIERLIVALVIIVFVFTSAGTLVLHGSMLTREDAIEISRNRNLQLIPGLPERAEMYRLEKMDYDNQTGAWQLVWHIRLVGSPSAARIIITHVIDAGTGKILHEYTLGLL